MYRTRHFVVFLVCVLIMVGQVGAGLIAHWRLDEGTGTTAHDDTGNGYNGTLNGDPTWVAGVYKGALELDGTGDYVDFGDPQNWPDGAAPRSLCGWGLSSTIGSGYRWLAAYGSPSTSAACFIGMNGARIIGGGYNGDDVDVADFWDAGEWHHVALTYDGTTARLYGDGVELDAVAKSWNLVLSRAFIGEQVNSAGEYWNGMVDEICLFDHVLSLAEIQDVMAGMKTELAGDPDPEDEAVDVPRAVVLGWTPGEFAARHNVYLGTVREDVNDATRSDSRGVLVGQNLNGATYDCGRLDFGQTYYWRVDEVNAAPDSTIYKGDVWSFTTEPLAYPVENVVATTNGTSEGGALENLVNGTGLNEDDQHSVVSDDMWVGVPPAGETLSLQFAFDGVYKLYEMQVWNYNVQYEALLGFGFQNVMVQYSMNGTDWTTLGTVDFARGPGRADYTANTLINFHGLATRHVRLVANTGFGTMGKYGLSEVRFLYLPVQARQPQPADGQMDVNPNGTLSWRSGREADSHELYLSSSEGAVIDGTALVATATENRYPLDELDLRYDTAYYWRIVEVNQAETVSAWEGPVWSFTTQEYAVVDSFESYNDEDHLIYESWTDGWTNGTGSTVGYLTEPFAETVTVHTGSQAMPFFYDNVAGLTSAEADLTLGAVQDWTRNGIHTLSLAFYGQPDNTGQLYLKINDTKVTYDGDADDISSAVWLVWNVDLTALGGNFERVTKLTIGVEGAGARGTLYIDDIRLYTQVAEYITPTKPDAANLVARYALDGNPSDSSGNGYDGTEIDGPTYVAGMDGQAMQFDGVDDYVDIGNATDWPAGAAPRTMSLWAQTNSVEAGYRFAVAYGTGSTGQAMFIGINGTTLYGGGYGDDVSVANFWVTDEWYHLALTYDGITARFYAGGVEIASAVKAWNLVLSRAHIGQQVNNSYEFWNGMADEVRIYGAALSAGEVAWLAGRTEPLHKPF